MVFYDFDGFTCLLTRPDLGSEDRLMVCKTMADLCAIGDNALKMACCPGLPRALADILSSTPVSAGGRTDERHQAWAALCVTRCVCKCSAQTCTQWALTPGLVDGLSTLRKSSDKFLQITSLVALRMLVRCDDAVGSSKKLLRIKWRGALVEGSSSRGRGESSNGTPSTPSQLHNSHDELLLTPHKLQAAIPQESPANSRAGYSVGLPPQPSASTPFCSTRLGSVQRSISQQQIQSQQTSPHSMHPPQSPTQRRWMMGDSSFTAARPAPFAYKHDLAAREEDMSTPHTNFAYGDGGGEYEGSAWASARETKPASYNNGSDTRSPYSSSSSVYSGNVGGSGVHFQVRGGGYTHQGKDTAMDLGMRHG